MRKEVRFVAIAIAGLGIGLAGCTSIKGAAGLNKQAPDEFAVVTKAPLIIPPDFNLKPPKPGAAPTNQPSPSAAAEAALFSDDPSVVASSIPGQYSEGERLLLAYAHAATADDSIRAQLASDQPNVQGATPGFVTRLLFGNQSDAGPNGDVPVDAQAEQKRLEKSKSGTQSSKQDDDDSDKDSGGWLDGIF